MKATALIPVEEYLRTTHRPDCGYVDGEVLERNSGEKDHSKLQREIIFYFRSREREWNAFCFPGQRVQVGPGRYRMKGGSRKICSSGSFPRITHVIGGGIGDWWRDSSGPGAVGRLR